MKAKENAGNLGTEKLSRLMLRYSVPCVLSLLITALYNVVDQIFIGNSRLSTLGNAATSVIFPFFIVAHAFAWCYGDGAAAYLSICQGKNRLGNIHKTIGTGISITFITGLVLVTVFSIFKIPLLSLFGASENSIDLAVEYFDIIIIMFPLYMLSNMMNAVIRADGSPGWAMNSLLIGAVINVILDPLFIFSFDWGMTGAALATVLGQFISFLANALYFTKAKTFKLTLRDLIPDFKSFSYSLKLGISTFITQITIVATTLMCNIMLVKYGAQSEYGVDIPIACIGIESKIFTLVINVIVGIVLGCQPIISYNMGAGNYGRVRKLYFNMILIAAVIGLSATAVFQFAPQAVLGMFGTPSNIPNPEYYWEFGKKTFRIYLLLVTFTCITKISTIFFQAVGKPAQAAISALVREVFCFIPLIVLLPLKLGIEGVLWAAPASDLAAITVTAIMMTKFLLSIRKKESI